MIITFASASPEAGNLDFELWGRKLYNIKRSKDDLLERYAWQAEFGVSLELG